MVDNTPTIFSSVIDQIKKNKLSPSEVHEIAETHERNYLLVQQLFRYADDLNRNISELRNLNRELKEAYIDTLHRLAVAIEYRDSETGDHIQRMGQYCTVIARGCGFSDNIIQNLRYAAPMHDIGKIGIPDHILLKPGKLTAKEFEIMKTHTTIGANILADSKAEVLQVAQKIALSHHEKWNGKGYPQGLSKDKIPLEGRIVGLIDVFDSLISKRPYKDVYPIDVALDIIHKEKEEHFDPELVEIFFDNIDEIISIKGKDDCR
ncbi:MAG: HD domain-containing protein [Deltaproteobacteria bacterium]|nr:HD domain-containing protein [Deltaproteobacteria bacterium]